MARSASITAWIYSATVSGAIPCVLGDLAAVKRPAESAASAAVIAHSRALAIDSAYLGGLEGRQGNHDGRPLAFLRDDADLSAAALNNAAGHGQPQSTALTLRFRGEK